MNIIWEIIVFASYSTLMIVVGLFYRARNEKAEDYFIGGKTLGGIMAGLSSQASIASGWIMLGLTGSFFLSGMLKNGWILLGILIGGIFDLIFVAPAIRKCSLGAGDAVTLPMFFEHRYMDSRKIITIISSVTIAVFFTVYTASAFAAGGKLFNSVFKMDYHIALTIGAAVIMIYTLTGGFLAVCATDVIQACLMLVGLIATPIFALILMKGCDLSVAQGLQEHGVNDLSSFLNLFADTDPLHIISGLAWGLGDFAMPHVLVRFMAVRNEQEMKKTKVVAIVYLVLTYVFAAIIGIVGRAFMDPSMFTDISSEYIFIEMIKRVFTEEFHLPIITGLFLCGILAAIMSSADSQLLVAASAVTEDIYKGVIHKDTEGRSLLRLGKLVIVGIAIIAYIIAWDPESSVMNLVGDAWAGLGSSFGPLVITSLFWQRTNLKGAIAGITSGAAIVILWDYVPMVGGSTLGTVTGLYSLAPGFIISLLCIIVVSLLTEKPSEEILKILDNVKKNQP